MKLQALCRRTTWEIVRDPLNLAFGLGFPLVLLLLLSAIQANVPVDLFAIDRLTLAQKKYLEDWKEGT